MSLQSLIRDFSRRRHTIRTATVDAAFVGGGVVAQRVFGLLTAVVIARSASIEVFGEYTLFMTFVLVFSQVPLALDGTFIRFANSYQPDANDTHVDVDTYLATSVIAKVLWGALVCVLAWVCAPYLAATLLEKPEMADSIRMGAVVGNLQALGTSLFSRFQQRKNFAAVGVLDPLFNAIALVGVFAASFGTNALSMNIVLEIYLGAAVVFAAGGLAGLALTLAPRLGAAVRGLPTFSRIGGILVPAAVLMVVAERVDVFFIARLITLDDIGHYGAAIRLSTLSALFTGVIVTILVPHAPPAVHDPRRRRSYLRLAAFYCAIQSLIGVALIGLSGRLGVVAFGPEYAGLQALTGLLILQQLFGCYATPFQALIRYGPRPQNAITLSVVRIFISVALLNILAPRFGIMGAAGAMALTSVIQLGMSAWVALRAMESTTAVAFETV
jgi:O-antigen/teichoic acid export membrane protein